jgi:hypothetical protein
LLTAETTKLRLPDEARLLGGSMKARRLVMSGSYDPDQLRALGKAFDEAWARIAPTISGRAKAVEATRLQLADIVLSLGKSGNFDPQWLADTAVHAMLSRSSRSRR